MKTQIRTVIVTSLLSVSLSSCLMQGGSGSTQQQNSILASEVITICGAMVGDQAEQRINQEWTKHPEAEVNRPIIEAVAESLLNDPNSTEQQRSRQYKKYLTCATGLLMTKGMIK